MNNAKTCDSFDGHQLVGPSPICEMSSKKTVRSGCPDEGPC